MLQNSDVFKYPVYDLYHFQYSDLRVDWMKRPYGVDKYYISYYGGLFSLAIL